MAGRALPATSAAAVPPAHTPDKVRVKVRLHARESSLEPQPDGSFIARLKAEPVDGKANEELIALVARHFGLARARVEIASGAAGRLKLLRLRTDR